MAQTQWRVGPFALIGIDYTAAIAIAEAKGIEMTPAILAKIQALERYELSKQQEGGNDQDG
jgi:hypothetical protein